jgi:hypothetical protein
MTLLSCDQLNEALGSRGAAKLTGKEIKNPGFAVMEDPWLHTVSELKLRLHYATPQYLRHQHPIRIYLLLYANSAHVSR